VSLSRLSLVGESGDPIGLPKFVKQPTETKTRGRKDQIACKNCCELNKLNVNFVIFEISFYRAFKTNSLDML